MFVGIFYFPMAFLAVAILDSVAAANPLVIVPSILKVPVEYFVTVIVLSAVFVVRWLGGLTAIQANAEALSTTDMSVMFGGLAVRVLWGLISVYLLTVAVRYPGLLYVTQRRNWDGFDPAGRKGQRQDWMARCERPIRARLLLLFLFAVGRFP
jgi:hypothetical protein